MDARGEGDDLGGGFFGAEAGLDLVSACAGHELLREAQSSLVDIRHDEGFRARSGAAQQRDQADGPSAADEDAITEGDARALEPGQGDAEGLEHGAVFEAHAADFVAPDGRVGDVAAEEAVHGWGGEEAHGVAAVVAPCEAGFARVADHIRFNGDAVARGEVRDGGVDGEDFARGFVPEDVVVGDDHGADAASVPEVDVGSGGRGRGESVGRE